MSDEHIADAGKMVEAQAKEIAELRAALAEQQRHSGRRPTIYAHDPEGFINETSTGKAAS